MSVTSISLKEKRKHNPQSSTRIISFKAPRELDEVLEDVARFLNCKKSDVIRKAILYYIKHDSRVRSVLSKRYIELLEALTGGRRASFPQTRKPKSDSSTTMRDTINNIEYDIYYNANVETIRITT